MSTCGFQFTSERKAFYSALLGRIKPRLNDFRIVWFIDQCEKEISGWLADWPRDGWRPDKNRAARHLNAISHHAEALAKLVLNGDEYLNFRLAVSLLRTVESGNEHTVERGVSQQEVILEIEALARFLMKLSREAAELKQGSGEPIRKQPARELATRLSAAYAEAFGTVPSLNPSGIYRQFLDELSEIDLPQGFRVKISREDQRIANERAQLFIR